MHITTCTSIDLTMTSVRAATHAIYIAFDPPHPLTHRLIAMCSHRQVPPTFPDPPSGHLTAIAQDPGTSARED